MVYDIQLPLDRANISTLRAGDQVRLSGVLYTARDKAHQRLVEMLNKKEALPIDLSNQVIYYAGPTPAKPGRPIGSVGPTTASRMDGFTPKLLHATGLLGMIGKGPRNQEVVEAMVSCGAVYFVAIGGCGAAIAESVQKAEVVAYHDLGTEAIRRLEVKDFAAIVAIDSQGNNLFEFGPERYREEVL